MNRGDTPQNTMIQRERTSHQNPTGASPFWRAPKEQIIKN